MSQTLEIQHWTFLCTVEDGRGAATQDGKETDHLEASESLQRQPPHGWNTCLLNKATWTLYPTNRDQKEVRNSFNILRYMVFTALLTLVPLATLLSLSRGTVHLFSTEDLICYLRIPENLHIQHSTYRKGEIWSTCNVYLPLCSSLSL